MTQQDPHGENSAADKLDHATNLLRTFPISSGPSFDLIASTLVALQANLESHKLTDGVTSNVIRLQKRSNLMFRIARYSGATSALILMILGLVWLMSDHTSSKAFADVMQKVKQASSVSFQQRQKLGTQTEIKAPVKMRGDAVRIEFFDSQFFDSQVVVYDLGKQKGVQASPFRQQVNYDYFDLTDEQVKQIPNVLQALRTSKEHSVERLGEEVLNGRRQETFRLKKFHPLIGAGTSDLTLWADAETGLPSKIEARWVDQPGEDESYIVMENFDWNAKFDPSLFDLKHPNVDCLRAALSRSEPINEPKHVLPTGTKQIQLSGHVLAPDGAPQAGAKVFASGMEIKSDWTSPAKLVATSDAQGRFEATVKLLRPDAIERMFLTSTGDSAGLSGISLKDVEKLDNITLQLVEQGESVHGRILDATGKPAAGVAIRLLSLSQRKPGATARITVTPDILNSVTTDVEGRFSLKNLGSDRIADIEIAGASVERTVLHVSTTTLETPGKLLNPKFEHQSRPARTVKGQVFDADSKAPLSGIQITISQATGSVITDAEGQFEFQGAPSLDQYGVMAVPLPREQPDYLIGSLSVSAPNETDPVMAEIGLSKGIRVTGRVLDAETGRPVRTQIAYFPLYPNPNLKPNMGYVAAGGGGATSEAYTFWDETFSIAVLPGPGALCLRAIEEGRYEPVRVNPDLFFKNGEYGGDQRGLARGNLLLRQELKGVSAVIQDQYQSIILLNPKPGQEPLQRTIRLKRRHQ